MQFDLTSEEVRSFALGFFRFSLIEGPMRLVRFSHSAAGEAGRLGRFWMHASDIAALLAQPGTGCDLIGPPLSTGKVATNPGLFLGA